MRFATYLASTPTAASIPTAAEKSEIEQELAEKSGSDRLRRELSDVEKEIANLSSVGPLYETNRFSQVKLSEYVIDFIKQKLS